MTQSVLKGNLLGTGPASLGSSRIAYRFCPAETAKALELTRENHNKFVGLFAKMFEPKLNILRENRGEDLTG